MKLQINNSGAWKNVINFRHRDMAAVMRLAAELGEASAEMDEFVGWRVVNEVNQVEQHWSYSKGWEAFRPHARQD